MVGEEGEALEGGVALSDREGVAEGIGT